MIFRNLSSLIWSPVWFWYFLYFHIKSLKPFINAFVTVGCFSAILATTWWSVRCLVNKQYGLTSKNPSHQVALSLCLVWLQRVATSAVLSKLPWTRPLFIEMIFSHVIAYEYSYFIIQLSELNLNRQFLRKERGPEGGPEGGPERGPERN